jgi:hypothetical protein
MSTVQIPLNRYKILKLVKEYIFCLITIRYIVFSKKENNNI